MLLKDANKELKKAVTYITNYAPAWDDKRNLKLYDVAMYDYSNDFPLCYAEDENTEQNNFFWFCEDNYKLFMDWMEQEYIDKDILNYIGRTSWFTIGKYANRRLVYGISDILEDCHSFNYIDIVYIDIVGDFKISIYDNYDIADEEVQSELEYIINNLYEDVKYNLDDIIKVAEYIDNFKSNALEDFREFLEIRECDLQDQKRTQEKHTKKIRQIIEKSNLTAEEKDFLRNSTNRRYKKMLVKNMNGYKLDFKIAVILMDDEIREYLNRELAPSTDQEFFTAYEKAHEKKYGIKWELSKYNPCW